MTVSAAGGDFEVRSGATLNTGLMRLPPTEGRGVLGADMVYTELRLSIMELGKPANN